MGGNNYMSDLCTFINSSQTCHSTQLIIKLLRENPGKSPSHIMARRSYSVLSRFLKHKIAQIASQSTVRNSVLVFQLLQQHLQFLMSQEVSCSPISIEVPTIVWVIRWPNLGSTIRTTHSSNHAISYLYSYRASVKFKILLWGDLILLQGVELLFGVQRATQLHRFLISLRKRT